jgi:hypothetical protein
MFTEEIVSKNYLNQYARLLNEVRAGQNRTLRSVISKMAGSITDKFKLFGVHEVSGEYSSDKEVCFNCKNLVTQGTAPKVEYECKINVVRGKNLRLTDDTQEDESRIKNIGCSGFSKNPNIQNTNVAPQAEKP